MRLGDLDQEFTRDGTEGNRVGYWCDTCKKAMSVNERDISWNFSGPLADGYHKPCGKSVESIWRD